MTILLGADHRGFHLKEKIKPWLIEQGHQVIDVGNTELDPEDDYPVISFALADALVSREEKSLGVLLCGSGVGAAIAANKVAGIRCGLGYTTEQVESARHDDEMNILALAADYISEEVAKELVTTFIATEVSDEPRHLRRIEQIKQRE
ncbi:RpiB/LacA/LacB family sugar-phosphate isomerase [Patescibacteria group bacterium]|nr:RpiB/LacA/LacB family sugar-phosphate isomerase [Patescibacteria group bacterium]